jgi:hypothetical protein
LSSNNNPITNNHRNRYTGNLKLVRKENNTFYYEEKSQDEKFNYSKNILRPKSLIGNKTLNSNFVKESMQKSINYNYLTERDSTKPNNKAVDDTHYHNINHKKYNKMKFQHFNYEPNRGYYV